MKNRLRKSGVSVADWKQVSSINEAEVAAREIGFPIVLKPIDFGGSGGVIKVEKPQDLRAAFEESATHLEMHGPKFGATINSFLIEKYFPSKYEVSVEVLSSHGHHKAFMVTDKLVRPEPYFGEIGHIVPSQSKHVEKIKETAEKACAALNIQHGVSHVEIKVFNSESMIVLEVGARTAGDGIMDICERVMGESPYSWHIRAFLADLELSNWQFSSTGGAAIIYLNPDPGTLKEISHSCIDLPTFQNVCGVYPLCVVRLFDVEIYVFDSNSLSA
jgi:biotin carboxylase